MRAHGPTSKWASSSMKVDANSIARWKTSSVCVSAHRSPCARARLARRCRQPPLHDRLCQPRRVMGALGPGARSDGLGDPRRCRNRCGARRHEHDPHDSAQPLQRRRQATAGSRLRQKCPCRREPSGRATNQSARRGRVPASRCRAHAWSVGVGRRCVGTAAQSRLQHRPELRRGLSAICPHQPAASSQRSSAPTLSPPQMAPPATPARVSPIRRSAAPQSCAHVLNGLDARVWPVLESYDL